jgi:hypothetical protein
VFCFASSTTFTTLDVSSPVSIWSITIPAHECGQVKEAQQHHVCAGPKYNGSVRYRPGPRTAIPCRPHWKLC